VHSSTTARYSGILVAVYVIGVFDISGLDNLIWDSLLSKNLISAAG
jgi:hypothetical protein